MAAVAAADRQELGGGGGGAVCPTREPSQQGKAYTRIRDIGQGSYGKAVLVQDREGKLFVMKIIDMSRMDSKQRKDAINEVRVLSSLKHPYIVSYRESYVEHRNLAIVMDYADGGDLNQRVQRTRKEGRTIPEEKAWRWFTEATLALKYLHDKHVLHRDLKSQNLFLTSQDRLRLGDFGISKVLESTAAFANTTIGTPYYLSPEICMERPYSYSSDIWALGCVLFEIAALRVPFDAPNLQALVQKITRGPAPVLPSACSSDLKELCIDLLHRDKDQRPTAAQILARPVIQTEIRRMLRDEHDKGKENSAGAAGPLSPGGPGAVQKARPVDPEEVARPLIVRRRVSDRSDRTPSIQKTPSILSEEEGMPSARHHGAAAAQAAAVLKGVGASVCMDSAAKIRDPSPGRSPFGMPPPPRNWDCKDAAVVTSAVAAGVPSRLGTPVGHWRRY